ncbi:uncharacterized protein [Aristolochia californica]|uniref:uncharacterized protein n=1 Tax=Aristolochia californica TaxID=171875 RepID=UPI0035DEA58D
MAHSCLNSEIERATGEMQNYCKYVFSSSDPLESLLHTTYLLYLHGLKLKDCGFYFLKLWGVVGRGLKEQIKDVGNLNFLQNEMDHTGYLVVYWLLLYPFVMSQVWPTLLNQVKNLDGCLISSEVKLELGDVLEVWKSLYDSADCALKLKEPPANSFADGLCQILLMLSLVDENAYQCGRSQNPFYLFIYGEIAMYIVEKTEILNKEKQPISNIKNCLKLTARFLTVSWTMVEASKQFELSVVSRMFATLACFVGHFCLKEDILSLMEIFSDPLVHWLSSFASVEKETQKGIPQQQLLIFWTTTLDIMQRKLSSIVFNSLLLGAHAPILVVALDHPCSSISDATIAFWNSTYGDQSKLNYPQNLLTILDRLSRKGRVKLPKGGSGFVFSKPFNEDINVRQKHKVTVPQTRSSSHVEFAENAQKDSSELDLRRKRLKLRVACQEKAMDSGRSIHAAGVSSSADFIPRKATLHLREECRSSDSILQMLRRSG